MLVRVSELGLIALPQRAPQDHTCVHCSLRSGPRNEMIICRTNLRSVPLLNRKRHEVRGCLWTPIIRFPARVLCGWMHGGPCLTSTGEADPTPRNRPFLCLSSRLGDLHPPPGISMALPLFTAAVPQFCQPPCMPRHPLLEVPHRTEELTGAPCARDGLLDLHPGRQPWALGMSLTRYSSSAERGY